MSKYISFVAFWGISFFFFFSLDFSKREILASRRGLLCERGCKKLGTPASISFVSVCRRVELFGGWLGE